MSNPTSLRRRGALLAVVFLVPGALAAACSNGDNPQPIVYGLPDSGPSSSPDTGTSGRSNDSGPGGSPSDDASPSDDGGSDAPVIVTQPDGAVVPDAATCVEDSGCWSCTPTSASEFLNQCTSSQCSPFSNATRLPNYDGGLPPLN